MNAPMLAPELAAYADQPGQLPAAGLGKQGFLRLGFERRGARTLLTTLRRRAPLLVQQALHWDEELPGLACVPIITTSGGIVQGDRYAIEVELGPHAQAHVTTQAATKIHEMDANHATQTQSIVLAEGAYLEYLPHPVIPHRHARFAGSTSVVADPGATLLYAEILMPGRKYYGAGERFVFDLYASTFSASRPDGMVLFTERMVIDPASDEVRRCGVMGGFDVFGNIFLLTPKVHAERILAACESMVDLGAGLAAGTGRLPAGAGLVHKILGMEAAQVRAKLREFWALVRTELTGARLGAEFLWA